MAFPRRRWLNCSSSLVERNAALQAAAKQTVDTFIKSGMVVGLGSGLGSHMAIQYLGRQLRLGGIKDILGIPRSVCSTIEAAKAGIPLDQYQDTSQIDFAFIEVNIIEEGTLISVVGRRRLQDDECIIQEKIMESSLRCHEFQAASRQEEKSSPSASVKSVLKAADEKFIVTEKNYKGIRQGSIPVSVKCFNWSETAEEIEDLFLGDAEVWRRPCRGDAGPTGGDFPLITLEGHNILDLIFTSPIEKLAEVAKSLDSIEGLVDHGVISKMPCTAVIASENGLCIVENPPKDEQNQT